ncbi:MAG: sigma-54 dependent transcriptional regulator [Bacteroidota bacterium]|nr:sigma-54 dependent transcriptional regulator [Bacteroidota bacterium]MDX5431911.1 sigma-54 dependent transcriptional regulator [Bacteroidota bacterium]MDX5470625.1 sigma-54 dependent transcriptional regulator [Bacteroidota bacterium]
MATQKHILLVEDDEDIQFAAAYLLRQHGYQVSVLSDPESVVSKIAALQPDVLLLDMNFRSAMLNGNEGLFWLRQIKQKFEVPVIAITAFGEIDLAVATMQSGASDFITNPWKNERLLEVIQSAFKKSSGKRKPSVNVPSSGSINQEIIGNSESMLQLKAMIAKIAPTDASVLILGENGTGKDLVARAIHQSGKRAEKPWVAVDLGAIPESLFESTLFVHKKGAFTDAREDFAGRFLEAHGGTLFLDELGNVPLHLQSKMLLALQNREVQALGSSSKEPIDVRVISATNAALEKLIPEGKFRQDLYYRLNTVTLQIPPLRERGDDILLLANNFLERFAKQYEKEGISFSEQAIEKMVKHSWPGNVRELAHAMERAVILCDHHLIQDKDIQATNWTETAPSASGKLEDLEKKTIQQALDKHAGNISAVSNELGLSRAALYRRLTKYNL